MSVEPFFAQASSCNWRTPPHIIDAARNALGGRIGLDPCGPSGYAEHALCLADGDNGLDTSWINAAPHPTALINPPFGATYVLDGQCLSQREWSASRSPDARRQTICHWAEKALEEAHRGVAVIWISKAATETRGLQMLLDSAQAVCFPRGRVKYCDQAGMEHPTPTFPSLIIGIGLHYGRFRSAFGSLGACR